MGTNRLRAILNRLCWDPGLDAAEVVLQLRERIAGREELVEVRFASVVEILTDGVTVADGTFLPYHRIVAVRRGAANLWGRSASHEE